MKLRDIIIGELPPLPPFPAVLQRVLELIEDPRSSAADLVGVIQYDQSITSNVLRVCNSAYFALRQPVKSLREAVVRIGFNQLLEIVVSHSTGALFLHQVKGYDMETDGLWRHSVACALLAQIVGPRVTREDTPAQFTAALLHDIGKNFLHTFVHAHIGEIQRRVREEKRSFAEAEKEVLGLDHTEIGEEITRRWNFPSVLVSGIRYHHMPLRAPSHDELVSLVHICDVVARMTGMGGGTDALAYPGEPAVMEKYNLKEKDLESFIAELGDRRSKIDLLLNASRGGAAAQA
ncbi:MAG TPA: HDOD domain-containing protein [Thermodesulfobacteriota bacterium]|nr:HDOD domain-containing protein [Thermodesulfobacteriota bacterium]